MPVIEKRMHKIIFSRGVKDSRFCSEEIKVLQKGMKNQLPSSVETVLSIDDLLMDILLRLPAQSIIRFKSVSKFWYSVITNPELSFRHRKKPASATGILFLSQDFVYSGAYEFAPLSVENPASPPFTILPLADDPSLCTRIQQSCNGLLLCSSFKRFLEPELRSDVPPDFVFQYFVCNPTTKRFITLQDPGLEALKVSSSSWVSYPARSRLWIQGMSLAFDPAKSPHYEVVCVVCEVCASWLTKENETYAQFQIKVYSSETRSWRKSGKIFTYKSDFGKHGVFWNGAVHWIYNDSKDFCYYRVIDETLHRMPMPPLQTQRRLVESCDHLHLIDVKNPIMGVYFKFYEMKRDHSEWFLKYHLDLLSPTIAYNRKLLTLLVLVRNKENDDAYLVVGNTGKMVVRYRLVENPASASEVSCEPWAWEKFKYHPAKYVCSHVSQFFEFTESLVSV